MTFMLEEEDDLQWQTTKRTPTAEKKDSILWETFLQVFRKKYFLEIIRECNEVKFLELVQGTITVVQYEDKFTELAHFAPHVVVEDSKKAFKFEKGKKPSICSSLSALPI